MKVKTSILSALAIFFSAAFSAGALADAGKVYIKPQSASVSSFDDSPGGWAPKPDPLAVMDGNLQTRWASKAEDPQWVALDFGAAKTIDEVIIRWERAFSPDYALEVSEDGLAWQKVYETTSGKGGVERASFKPVKAKFLRLFSRKRINAQWGVSLWELEAYGSAAQNPGDLPINEVYKGRVQDLDGPGNKLFKAAPPVKSPGALKQADFQTGVSYTSWHESELASPESDRTMAYLKEMNARNIAIVSTWFQKDANSTEIYPHSPYGGMTPSDDVIKHAINTAHRNGMKVLLKPHFDVEDGTFRGEVYPGKKWFDSYGKFILHYAGIAQKYNVELYCVGVELKGATTWENVKYWRELIKSVRKIYKGPLTYAANWDEYENVDFWDALDYIGIDAYFPLTDKKDAKPTELVKGWDKWADKIEKWRQKNGFAQPVIFTEAGYASVDGTNVQPWKWDIAGAADRQEQADCVQAAFEVLTKRDWFKGFYWWHYLPADGPVTEGLTLRGKQAEEVMSGWYEKIKKGGNAQ